MKRKKKWMYKKCTLLLLYMMSTTLNAQQDTGIKPEGLYLGVQGFNEEVYSKNVGLLTQKNYSSYTDFVDGLTNDKQGTVLYYAADNALNTLQNMTMPSNVKTIALVSFTDGLDNGSFAYTSDYTTEKEYSTALKKRIRNTLIDGIPLTAYAIGLKGNDVINNTTFLNNLESLSSTDANAIEIQNIDELDTHFQSIANGLKTVTSLQDITFTVTKRGNGQKIRFVLDGKSPTSSTKYIEATFSSSNSSECSLTNIKYVGFMCKSGTMVLGEAVSKINYNFTFSSIQTETGEGSVISSQTDIKQYNYIDYSWQVNSEFTTGNIELTNNTEYNSAVILLSLDCSTSLGEEGFLKVKDCVKTFIRSLSEKAMNEPVILSGDVNADGLVDKDDANAILDMVLGVNIPANQTEADVDDDGRVTVNDAVMLIKDYKLAR